MRRGDGRRLFAGEQISGSVAETRFYLVAEAVVASVNPV